MTETAAPARPAFPHLESLERVLAHMPDFLDQRVTVTEKIDGFNARVGRDPDGAFWLGTRTQTYDMDGADVPSLQGFRDFARASFGDLAPGVTVYGEWAGTGVRADYGEKTFYLFAERTRDDPVISTAAVLDQHWISFGGIGFPTSVEEKRRPSVSTVPVIYEGVTTLDVLDELRAGTSIVVQGRPIEGVVVAPIRPLINSFGGQVIAKHKSAAFAETSSARRERAPVDMERASGFAAEYVTEERFSHVLAQVVEAAPGIDPLDVEHTGAVLRTMHDDVVREGKDDYDALAPEDRRLVGKAVNKESLKLLDGARAAAARG